MTTIEVKTLGELDKIIADKCKKLGVSLGVPHRQAFQWFSEKDSEEVQMIAGLLGNEPAAMAAFVKQYPTGHEQLFAWMAPRLIEAMQPFPLRPSYLTFAIFRDDSCWRVYVVPADGSPDPYARYELPFAGRNHSIMRMDLNVWLDELVSDKTKAAGETSTPQLVVKQLIDGIRDRFETTEADEEDVIAFMCETWGVEDDAEDAEVSAETNGVTTPAPPPAV